MNRTTTSLTAVAVGLLAIACSGAPTGTTGPGATSPATTPAPITSQPVTTPAVPATDAPPATPPGEGGVPGATLVPDQPLEDLFPDEIGGQQLDVQSATGASVNDLFPDEDQEFADLLAEIGTSIENVSAAYAFSIVPGPTEGDFGGLFMTALRVRNVPAQNVINTFIEVSQRDAPGSTVATATIGGKTVTTITDPEEPDSAANLYAVGDVVFFVGGTPELVEEAFNKLP